MKYIWGFDYFFHIGGNSLIYFLYFFSNKKKSSIFFNIQNALLSPPFFSVKRACSSLCNQRQLIFKFFFFKLLEGELFRYGNEPFQYFSSANTTKSIKMVIIICWTQISVRHPTVSSSHNPPWHWFFYCLFLFLRK